MGLSEILKDIKLFLPVSTRLILWYVFVLAYMLADLILTVIVNCFRHDNSRIVLFHAINNILPFILIADMLISFNTGFIKNGKIILNRKTANKQYIFTVYFWCDSLALITSILQIIFHYTFMREITLFNYVIFIKLTKAFFLDSLFKKYIIKSFNVALLYEVSKNFLILATLSHIIGSFYFYIDVLMYESNWYGTSQLWIFSAYAYPNIYTSDFWIQYTYSYYVACVTLSGTAYGDIIPLNPYQNLYIFCCFIFPMLIYSYVYSSIFQALFNKRTMSSRIRRYKFLAKQYLKSLGVSSKIMNKILTYLQFTHKKNMIVDTEFIQGLAPTIKEQYLHQIMEGKFQFDCFNPILQIAELKHDYIRVHLTPLIKQQFFPQRFPLIDIGKLKIYYVNTGKVVQVAKLNDTKKLSKSLPKFTHIAKIAFYTNQIPLGKLSIESNSFVMAHSIEYQQFKKISKQKMPSLNQSFCAVQSKLIDERQYHIMNEKCFFCDDVNHIIRDCPHLCIQRKSFENKTKIWKQERQKYNRDQDNKSSKSVKLQNKFPIVRKISNSFPENQNISVKQSKKIYQRKQNNYEKMVQSSNLQLTQNYMQQTIESDFLLDWRIPFKICKKNEQFEKVCVWDRFYPERNIAV